MLEAIIRDNYKLELLTVVWCYVHIKIIIRCKNIRVCRALMQICSKLFSNKFTLELIAIILHSGSVKLFIKLINKRTIK